MGEPGPFTPGEAAVYRKEIVPDRAPPFPGLPAAQGATNNDVYP